MAGVHVWCGTAFRAAPADLTVVLENGRVSQQGTHGELLRSGGRYAELFDLQVRHYR